MSLLAESLSHITSVSGKRWLMRPAESRYVMAVAQTLDIPEIIARLLVIRGINADGAQQFLSPRLRDHMPDPSHLKDMDKAVERLIRAIKTGEKICFFGDYDVDGATSTALMVRYFRAIGIETLFYIPDRIEEGYGPNITAFQILAKKGITVIVTLDCGTTSFEPIAYAQNLNVDVVVIDHHAAEPKLPNAYAVVNPNRMDQESSCQTLAAVGVAFLLLVALTRGLRQAGFFRDIPEPNLMQFLDLVALGTVCDVMQLEGLNRAFVHQGLKILATRQNFGLRALMDVGCLTSAPQAYHLGFVLGPRINAAGRIGCATYGVKLLITEDIREAQELAQKLNALNTERQVVEQEVLIEALKQAEEQCENPLIIVHGDNWHPGVIGIVAGRLKERFYRPVMVISFDQNHLGKGSGRSILGMDLGNAIHAARQQGFLEGGGGHAMAAGITIKRSQLDEFRNFLIQRIISSQCDLTPALTFDGYLAATALSIDFIEKLAQLEPYGHGNPAPRFVIENLKLAWVDVVGNNHLRLTLQTMDGLRLKGILFRVCETPLGEYLLKKPSDFLNILTAVKIDRWNGQESIKLEIDDIAVSSLQ